MRTMEQVQLEVKEAFEGFAGYTAETIAQIPEEVRAPVWPAGTVAAFRCDPNRVIGRWVPLGIEALHETVFDLMDTELWKRIG